MRSATSNLRQRGVGVLVGLTVLFGSSCGASQDEPKRVLRVPGDDGSSSYVKTDRDNDNRYISFLVGNLCSATGGDIEIEGIKEVGTQGDITVTGWNVVRRKGAISGLENQKLGGTQLGEPKHAAVGAECGADSGDINRLAVELRLGGSTSELAAIRAFKIGYRSSATKSASVRVNFGVVVCPGQSRTTGACRASWESTE